MHHEFLAAFLREAGKNDDKNITYYIHDVTSSGLRILIKNKVYV